MSRELSYQRETSPERLVLSPRGRNRLSAVLRKAGHLISVDDTTAALGIGRAAAAKMLARWQEQGWLSRVRRGLYAPVPLTAMPADHDVVEHAHGAEQGEVLEGAADAELGDAFRASRLLCARLRRRSCLGRKHSGAVA
ncbi:MAG: type IV toxin-antitoxin system AbiEi family antitoxin domain-containing protein [candidate division NC10 bacterium]|nr:type IV toxin-antitoxin system AbiEi family antitoxin domain-containing protein [candidate division NC10 bacterium]